MISRRNFLMAAISGAAMGCAALSTVLLRKGSLGRQGSAPKAAQGARPVPSAATVPPQAAETLSLSPFPQATLPLSGACPPVISRADWGALEPNHQATGEGGMYDAITNPDGWLIYDQPLDQVLHTIIVHHSALPLTDGPREIQALHMHDKGFADVGYHYIVDDQGKLYEARSMSVRGAHTYAHNFGTVGICLMGNFQDIQPAAAQLLTLREQIHCLLAQYPRIGRVAGHRDYNPGITLCPGDHLAELLPGIAQEAGLAYGA